MDVDPISEFSNRHNLKPTDALRRERVGLKALFSTNVRLSKSFAELDDWALSDPAIGLLLNLIHRNLEQAEGGLVAFVTGCGPSAEVAARASVELSVNILYILNGDAVSRLRSYFDYYLGAVDAQVRNWRSHASSLPSAEQIAHHEAAARREAANAALRDFLSSFPTSSEPWPRSIEERFRLINEGILYRTLCARMSSEAHGDAEETLRYFLGKVSGQDVLEKMASETWWNARFFVYFSICFFLRAAARYSGVYSLSNTARHVVNALRTCELELETCARHMGAGV
ncbi:MAG TPA: DUF5677 domain-containing protein [Hyphomicrobium sp.]|nr:DUF5677 domain-containing protein [Hyphomicrobium sp.]